MFTAVRSRLATHSCTLQQPKKLPNPSALVPVAPAAGDDHLRPPSDFGVGRRYACSMELLGRLPELTACKEALSGDRHHATAAIIAGSPGIGKTSLWRAVSDSQSSGAVVLRTTGIPGARAG